mgnify:CR=1 FL=1
MSDLPPGGLARARVLRQIFAPQRAYQVQYRDQDGHTHLSRTVWGRSDAEVRMRAGFTVDVLNVRPVLESEGPVEVRFQ